MARSAPTPDTLHLANGRFTVLSRIEVGAISSTFVVRDETAGVERLLILLDPQALRTEWQSRFEEAGRSLGAVRHPNVLLPLEGRKARRLPYLLLEHPGGGTLAHTIARVGPMDPATVARVGIQLAEALDGAHSMGIVHHQVQPSAVWLTAGGEVRLGGFELATLDGDRVGLEPCPYRPRDAPSTADPQCDLYGLGAVLYSLIRGEVLDSYAETALLTGDEGLVRVVKRCLAKADQRYPNAGSVRVDLERVLSQLAPGPKVALAHPPSSLPFGVDDPDLRLASDRPGEPPSEEDAAEEQDADWFGAERSTATPASSWVVTPPPPPVAPPDPEPEPPAAYGGRPAIPSRPPARTPLLPPRLTPPPGPSLEARFRVDPEILRRKNRYYWVGPLVRMAALGAVVLFLCGMALLVASGGALSYVAKDFELTAAHADVARDQMYAALDDQRAAVDKLVEHTPDPDAARATFRRFLESTEPTKREAAMEFLAVVEAAQADGGMETVTGKELDRQKRVRELKVADDAYHTALRTWQDRTGTLFGRALVMIRLARPAPP